MRTLLLGLSFLFVSGPAWAQATRIDPIARVAPLAGLDENDRFGTSMSIDGEWAVVGAIGGPRTARNGAAYVYRRAPEGWALHTELTPSGPAATCPYGSAVAVDGDRIMLNVNCSGMPGAWAVFEIVGGEWVEVDRIQAGGGSAGRVVLDDTRALLRTNLPHGPLVAERGPEAWAVTDTLTVPGWDDSFAPDLDGDRVALTGYRWVTREEVKEVAVVERRATGWEVVYRDTLDAALSASTLALSGDRLVLGGRSEAGPVIHLYERHPDGWAWADALDAVPDLAARGGVYDLDLDGDFLAAHVYLASPESARLVAFRLAEPDPVPTRLPHDRAGTHHISRLVVGGGRVLLADPLADGPRVSGSGAATIFEPAGAAWDAHELTVPGVPRTDSRFGEAIALDGSRMAATAPGERAVWVFRSDADGTAWAEEARLPLRHVAREPAPMPVVLEGDRLAVGYPTAGEVEAFRRDGGAWTTTGLIRPAPMRWWRFGEALALDGGRLLVGAPGAERAVLYEADGDGWRAVAELRGEPGDADFGSAVALDGGRALVASQTPRADGAVGRVAVFEADGLHWIRTGELAPLGPGAFGDAVALGGGWALAGAPVYEGPRATPEAAAVHRGVLGVRAATFASPLPERSLFGARLALDGDRALVGAPLADGVHPTGTAPLYDVGAAFLLEFDGMAWSEAREVPRPVDALGTRFGSAVAVFGRRLAVGAPEDPTDADDAGGVYLYASSFATPSDATPPGTEAALSAPSPNPARTRARVVLTLAAPSRATVTLHDALGRTLRTLLDRDVTGRVDVEIATADLAAGLYLVRAAWDGGAATRRLAVVR